MTEENAAPDPGPPPGADPETYYGNLFDSLGDAYWAASTVADKDRIQGLRDAAMEILTAITQSKLDGNTAQIEALTGVVTKTNTELEKLQKDINDIVRKIQVVGEVETAITQVLSLGGKLI